MIKKTNMCILMGDETVDVVYIDRSVLGVQIRFMERLPNNENLFEVVAKMMKSVEKMPSRVTLCVPRTSVIQRTLRYPAAVREDIGNMIQFEAARHVPLPEEERLLAWSTADLPDENQLVLNLAAGRKSEIRDWIDRFEEAGVPVDEAMPFSSVAAQVLSDVPTLLVLADTRHFELCLCGQGILQDSLLIRCDATGFSEDRLVAAARQMAAKHKDWLGDEGIGRIVAGGMEPLAKSIEEDFETAFGLHIHPIELPEDLVVDMDSVPLCEALLVLSTALPPTMNLIEDRQRKVPISKRTLLVSGLCIVLVIELLSAFALKTGVPALQRRKVANEIRDMRRKTEVIQEMKGKNVLFRKQLQQLEEVCGSRASSMEILKVVSDTLPEDTYLRQFRCGQDEIRLRGYSREPDKLPELVMSMPFVETISTSEIGSERDGYYDFTLSASLRR